MGEKRETQALRAACLCAALAIVSAAVFCNASNNNDSWMWTCGTGLATVLFATGTLLSLDIWRLTPADSHTLKSLISQYKEIMELRIKSYLLEARVKAITEDPMKVNEEGLMRIIRTNENSVYGLQHNFKDITCVDDFLRLHPLTNDKVNQPWMNRAAAGEKNLLYPGETVFLSSTSGTTGAPKVYPICKDYLERVKDTITNSAIYTLPMMSLKRYFRFHIFSKIKQSTGGLPMGAGSQMIQRFPIHNLTPEEYKGLHEAEASYYIMALFAMAERELYHIASFSADLTFSFMKCMVQHWHNLCDDIECGRVGNTVSMPEDIKMSLSNKLNADPERAEFLREAMKKGVVGLVKRSWPDMTFIGMGKSGGFLMAATQLMENHFKGIKIVNFPHGATEGITGINREKKPEVGCTHTLVPGATFMEFIPAESIEEDDPQTVQIDKLELGKCYEVVHTNENGLYRCRYGDVIKIVGFDNRVPKYEFLYRTGQRLNIAYDRTPENFLYEALTKAMKTLPIGTTLQGYTSTESTVIDLLTAKETKGHYVFIIEFNSVQPEAICTDLGEKIDKNIQELYAIYKRYRDDGTIADLEVIQVAPGSMENLKPILMGKNFNPQFKMPRVLRKEPAIRHFLENRVSN